MRTDSFVIQQNIERYRMLLKSACNAEERELLLKLLAEAEASDRQQCADPAAGKPK